MGLANQTAAGGPASPFTWAYKYMRGYSSFNLSGLK